MLVRGQGEDICEVMTIKRCSSFPCLILNSHVQWQAKASQVKKGGSVPLQLLSDNLLFESLVSKVSGRSLFTFIIF